MKQLIFITFAIGSIFTFISCERHEWEDSGEGKKDGTKNLYPQHEKEDHHDRGGEHDNVGH